MNIKEGEFELRQAKQDCFCRGCDKKIKRNSEHIIHTYSRRCKGQHIHFCIDCVEQMIVLSNKLHEAF